MVLLCSVESPKLVGVEALKAFTEKAARACKYSHSEGKMTLKCSVIIVKVFIP